MAKFDNATEIGRIDRSESETVIVRRLDDGSIDARIFIETDRYSGPTKKGLLLNPDEARQLAALIGKED